MGPEPQLFLLCEEIVVVAGVGWEGERARKTFGVGEEGARLGLVTQAKVAGRREQEPPGDLLPWAVFFSPLGAWTPLRMREQKVPGGPSLTANLDAVRRGAPAKIHSPHSHPSLELTSLLHDAV